MAGLARFENKVAIVTGAASGIGRAVVRRFVAEGGIVTGVDINEAGLAETVALANAGAGSGGRADYLTGSVAEEADVKRIVETVTGRAGRLDVLCNIAGVLRTLKTADTSLDLFLSVIKVNLGGTFLFCREAMPHLIKTRGNIVNTASTSAFFGHPYMAAYASSKGGVASLTRTLAWEYMREGVRVNAIAPGGIDTPLSRTVRDDAREGMDFSLFAHLTPLDAQMAPPETVAGVVAMLASEDGVRMSGEIVKMDGGVHN
jgi:NAD(P)-dependent dehydrogenase (short-subunit alcohol dehydrogenase family)